MNDAEAAQQLQTIRTLMERAALYRRALGPVLITVGVIGVVGAAVGCLLPVNSSAGFLTLWLTAAVLALTSALLLIRKQALRDQEQFWTPPARRVAAAMSPALFAGAMASLALSIIHVDGSSLSLLLPHIWSVCYGLGLHSAGFFTLRGIRSLGWGFIVGGGTVFMMEAMARAVHSGPFFLHLEDQKLSFLFAHLTMGVCFGFLHLVAGGKLLVEERYSLT